MTGSLIILSKVFEDLDVDHVGWIGKRALDAVFKGQGSDIFALSVRLTRFTRGIGSESFH